MENQSDENKLIGARIKELRKGIGDTQDNLAKKLNLSKQAISKIEQGRVALTFDNARRLADIYGVSTDWLCGRSDFTNYSPDILAKFIKYEKRKAKGFETRIKETDDDPYVSILMNYELHTYLMSMAIAQDYRENKKVYNTLVESAKKDFLCDMKYASKESDGSYRMHPLLLVEPENLDIEYQIDLER